MTGSWRQVATLAQLAETGMLAVKVDEMHVGLFMVDSTVYAIDNICTHGHACLTDGVLEGHLVECPLHAGLVDLRSGRPAGAPIARESRTYPVNVQDGLVFIQVAADTP